MSHGLAPVEVLALSLSNSARNGEDHADAARVAIASLEAAGFVIVPKEPTEDMDAAGSKAVRDCWSQEPGEGFDEEPAPAVYAAMLEARPR